MAKHEGKPGVMFYFDLIQPLLTQLSDEQVGQLFRVAFGYAQYGVLPSFDPGMLSMAWALIQPAIDRDNEAYNDKVLKTKYSVYCREQNRQKKEPMSFEDFQRTISADNDRHQPISTDNERYPTTTSTSITTPTSTTEAITASNTKTKSTSDTAPTSVATATTSADIESDQPISTDKPYVWEDTPEGRAAQAEYEDDELPF